MNSIVAAFARWFGLGGVLSERSGQQVASPSSAIVENAPGLGVDAALQISTVWRCVDLLCGILSTLPLFVYENERGNRTLARESLLWLLLHDTPNQRMTPSEFWCAMMLNLLLRGNAYARIDRSADGSPIALWPMPADQVMPYVLENGELVYVYQLDSDSYLLLPDQVLHLKGMGNGTVGLSRLEFMRASTTEAARAQAQATRLFANGNKPTGVLTIDRVLSDEQRAAIKRSFDEIAQGTSSRLYVLEADVKYQSVSLTPQDVQLLDTRRYGVEELCRWFGVPPVLVGHSNVTTWGSGVENILDGFYKLTVRPQVVAIEQAIAKRVLSPAQRMRYSVEFSIDALLRASLKDRMEIYGKAVQNGIMSRNESRQLENLPPVAGGDQLTAQTNLVPLNLLGKIKPQGANNAQETPVAQ